MGYTVYYGGERPKHERGKDSYLHICAILLIICVIAIGILIPQQSQMFLQTLFPWFNSDTRTAFAGFTEDLKEGESVSNALKAFCVEIIQHAKEPD